MENTKNFLFYSLAFSTGLLIYTIVLYLGYLLFLSDNEETEAVGGSESVASKEKISDLDNLDCLEDA